MPRDRISPQTAERVRNLARMVDAETLAEFILVNYWYGAGKIEDAVQRLAWEREYERLEKQVDALMAENKTRHERDKGRILEPADIVRAIRVDQRYSERIDACWKRMDELRGLMYGRTEQPA